MIIFPDEGSWAKYLLVSTMCNKPKNQTGVCHMLRLTWILGLTFQLGPRSPDLSDSPCSCPEMLQKQNHGDHRMYLCFSPALKSAYFTLYQIFVISLYNAFFSPKVSFYFNIWPVECVYFRANYLITYLRHISGISNKGTFKWCLRKKWRAVENGHTYAV